MPVIAGDGTGAGCCECRREKRRRGALIS